MYAYFLLYDFEAEKFFGGIGQTAQDVIVECFPWRNLEKQSYIEGVHYCVAHQEQLESAKNKNLQFLHDFLRHVSNDECGLSGQIALWDVIHQVVYSALHAGLNADKLLVRQMRNSALQKATPQNAEPAKPAKRRKATKKKASRAKK